MSWLVQNHLVMSTTAQRKDLSDPQVIFDFAQLVGDQTHLDYLYVLTVADINATNPTLWNSWRASLLRQLYTETKRALRRGLENPVDREEQIRQTQTAALDQLVRNGIDQDDAEQLWSQLGDDYFLRHTAGDVAWHTEAILQHPDDGTPLVLIKETTQREFESGSQIFIYAADQHDFFAVTVAAMDQLNLSIQDARIITSTSQFTLDTYIVLDADGDSIGNNPERIAEIREGLIDALKNPDDYPTIIQRRVPRQLKHFAFAPQVTISTDALRQVSVLEVIAPTAQACWRGSAASSWISTCRCRTPRSPPRRARGGRLLHHRCAQPAARRPRPVQTPAGRPGRAAVTRQRTGHPAYPDKLLRSLANAMNTALDNLQPSPSRSSAPCSAAPGRPRR